MRNRPRFSHSSANRRSACSTTVAAQRTSKIRSGGQVFNSCPQIDNCDGASAIHSSQATNCKVPPRFCRRARCCLSFKKFSTAVRRRDRKRPRAGSARESKLPLSSITKKSWVKSWASATECPRRQINAKTGRQYTRHSSVNALWAASCVSLVCAQDRTTLQRVVWNRFELRVSLPAGSDFTGGDDGMLGRYGQAQRLEAWAKRLAFHAGADLAF